MHITPPSNCLTGDDNSLGTIWNTDKPVCFLLSYALSVTQQYTVSKEQHEKHLCNPSSHYVKYREYARETHAPRINYWNTFKPVCFVLSYVLSITQQYKQRTALKVSLQSIQPLQKIWRIYL